jgi:excisionase family DNA binding protein
MRTAVYDTLTSGDPDELLTTGEAATLLSASRQHVADLCDRGDLPYTTVGTHRRVRRGDIEAIRTRTERLTRDQRRSLWLSYAAAAKIVHDPDLAIRTARANLPLMRAKARGQASRWLNEWEKLLDGPVDNLLDALTSRAPKGRELRQNSPFAALLDEAERQQVLTAWRNFAQP